ncbi:hypothetical protein BO86DRAFT_313592 [Aspergillus japonicus CBS 114.51]|uniref:Uncharacterized protein n=1 Tax=Aspergillus japonicus CBS 114.51 TaxID=1448312 RepID=A0A8T8X052_ASPJA|nr:hypothetical protein BO86DRAFT_313592 [Aspergillus japonicus CBS 114.51]RAH81507.1 hypothetical protein BO86DRAFT_313592 [Aspergillus japonicus CBS 114.51]
MQALLSPAHVWPGGIPSAVHLHPDSELDADDLLEESRGWCLFLKETWNPSSDPEEDRTQRRTLVERWAAADQTFRDSYHSRAPLSELTDFHGSSVSKRFVCLVDKPYEPENYSRITKLLILLYIHLQNTVSHPLSYNPEIPAPQLPAWMIDPAVNDDYRRLLVAENLPTSYYLETPHFGGMAMTRAGNVVFPRLDAYEYVVIDNQSCEDGRLCLLNFALNGQVAYQARVLPYHLGPLTSLRYGLGHLWSELMDERPEARRAANKPIDLHPPLLEIMAKLSQRGDLQSFNDYTPGEWAEEFERFAPGYLQYEQQGRVDEYSWDHLVDVSKDPFVTYNHLRNARRLAELQRRGPV